jgi:hypothetical protein
MLTRRDFLAGSAAVPFVFGLRELLSQEPKTQPGWYAQALLKMKETGRFGVVLVVPYGKAEREKFGATLQALLENASEGPRELFCEAVFVCVTSEIARACVWEPGERQNRFLLAPDGKRVEADTIDADPYEDPAKFLKSFGAFVHGPKGERLRDRALAIRESLGDDVKKALSRLDAETVEERDEASAILLKKADAIVPLLVETRISSKSEEIRARCRGILQKYFEASALPGPRLPFGGELAVVPPRDNCPGCGLVIVRQDARKFLRFLAK